MPLMMLIYSVMAGCWTEMQRRGCLRAQRKALPSDTTNDMLLHLLPKEVGGTKKGVNYDASIVFHAIDALSFRN